MVNSFEKGYKKFGFGAQRQYPNEAFLSFLGINYFKIPYEERNKLRFLEVGVGSGANLWAVAKEGFSAYGIDIAPTGVELCREMIKKWGCEAELKVGSMLELTYESEFFDCIYDVVSMQHINYSDHIRSWKEIYRCLKPGGKFFSYHFGENSVSLKSNPKFIDHATIERIMEGEPIPNHATTCFLSANEVRKELAEIGFINTNIEKITRTYNNQRQILEYLSIVSMK